jgi:hypothetical protein
MTGATTFRCPFEMQGVKDGTIIEVVLSEVQEERFEALKIALEEFHTQSSKIAIRLVLPQSVQSCTTFEELRDALMPFQAEIIAADLDDVLFPYLPHQKQARDLLEGHGLGLSLFDEAPAHLLQERFGAEMPDSIGALAAWILNECRMHMAVSLGETDAGASVQFIISSLMIHGRSGEMLKSMMSIVLAPLYPPGTGRYSERVEIVLTRQTDAAILPKTVRDRIRDQANASYLSHGLPAGFREVQPPGLWIPGGKVRI